MDEFTTIKTYDNYATAGLDKQRLESENILCYLADENTLALRWDLNIALGGIRLRVPTSEAERANTILGQTDNLQVDFKIENGNGEDVICPNCGSNNVATEKFKKGIFALSWIVLGFPIIRKSRSNHRCFYCGHEWRRDI